MWTLGIAVFLLAGFLIFLSIRGIPKYEPQTVDLKVEITPERVARGKYIASVQCIFCHLNKETHQLSGRFQSDLPKEFGKIYSRNITQDKEKGIGAWTDGQIAVLLRTGLRPDGQYIPVYMPKFMHLSDEDLKSVIAFLRSPDEPMCAPSSQEPPETEPSMLTKFLCFVAFKPFTYPKDPVPEPDTTNLVAYGKYLVTGRYDCYTCHSGDFKKMDMLEPEKSFRYCGGGNTILNMEGNEIKTANITPDKETGIGNWTEEQFATALTAGRTPNGNTLRYPMFPYAMLDSLQVKAIYAYLHQIPAISNKVDRTILPN